MEKAENKNIISQEDVINLLNTCYRKVLDGVPGVSKPVEDMAEEYLSDYPSAVKAVKAMVRNQVIKCTTAGVANGLSMAVPGIGFAGAAVAIPAEIGTNLYIQMRMIACCAYMAGYDLESDQAQTFIYACLAGVSLNKVLKELSEKFGTKVAINLIKKIPGKVLTKINKKVGFRFITKFGEKGLINLGKAAPFGVGAIVGGGFDLVETKIIGDRAIKWFCEGDFSVKENRRAKKAKE